MAQLPTSPAQLNGYRFLLRRLKHALTRRDVRMLHDPLRSQSRAIIIGFVITGVICVAALVLSILIPSPNLGESKIVISQNTGAVYVETADGVFNPVLNLASAELIVGGKYTQPALVSDESLRNTHRGPLIGITGGPAAINQPADPNNSWWTLCDDTPLNTINGTRDTNIPTVTEIIARPTFAGHNKKFR